MQASEKTARQILEAKTLSLRLALAIDRLEEDWQELPSDVQHPGGANRAYRALRAELRKAVPPDVALGALNPRVAAWLSATSRVSLVHLLVLVEAIDNAFLPHLDTPGLQSVLSSNHGLDIGLDVGNDRRVFLWPAYKAIARVQREIAAQAARRSQTTPLEKYEPRLVHHLQAIRFTRQVRTGRTLKFVNLPYYVYQRFKEFYDESGDKDEPPPRVRLGLFSMRGAFETRFAYTRPLADGKHGFRAVGMRNAEDSRTRLREIIQVACGEGGEGDGVDILLLPELTVDSSGLRVLAEEISARAESGGHTPALTFAGSFHLPEPDAEDSHPNDPAADTYDESGGPECWNVCTVLDQRGCILWSQSKFVPYPYPNRSNPAADIERCPPGLADVDLIEDIHRSREIVLASTPLGAMVIAICSDLVPLGRGSEELRRLPVDWFFVPSMSNKTTDFISIAKEIGRSGQIVCFANAAIVLDQVEQSTSRPPGFLEEPRLRTRPLAAFLSLPGVQTIGTWFDGVAEAPADLAHARVGIRTAKTWEGLIVDLFRVVDAYLTKREARS